MDQVVRIFIFLSWCIIVQTQPSSVLSNKFSAQIFVPQSQLETTIIVSSPILISGNSPISLKVTADKNKTICNSLAPGQTHCLVPQLQCTVLVETNYGKTYSFSKNDVTGGLMVRIDIGNEVSFTGSVVNAHEDQAEVTLDFQYDTRLTRQRGFNKSGNSTFVSFITETATVNTNPGGGGNTAGNGQSALYHGHFWGIIPLIFLPAFLFN